MQVGGKETPPSFPVIVNKVPGAALPDSSICPLYPLDPSGGEGVYGKGRYIERYIDKIVTVEIKFLFPSTACFQKIIDSTKPNDQKF